MNWHQIFFDDFWFNFKSPTVSKIGKKSSFLTTKSFKEAKTAHLHYLCVRGRLIFNSTDWFGRQIKCFLKLNESQSLNIMITVLSSLKIKLDFSQNPGETAIISDTNLTSILSHVKFKCLLLNSVCKDHQIFINLHS